MAVRILSFVNRFEYSTNVVARCARVGSRRLTMSASRSEKALDQLQSNPYYEKYAERITALQNAAPAEIERRMQSARPAPAPRVPDTRQFSSVLNPKEAIEDPNVRASDKKLEAIFKINLVEDKDALEIQQIWEEYHKGKDVISATIPSELYKVLQEAMRIYHTFLFPLPRSQGYEFMVHRENAPECLTMVHYPELREKGIVLMRGDYDKNVLTGQEAQCLANQFQMYYGGRDHAKAALLRAFHDSPAAFRHKDLIDQLESVVLA